MAIELVKYSTLKALLGLSKDSISEYPALGVIRESVTYAIEDYLGRDLEKAKRTVEIFVEDSPTQMISLRAIPINTVTSVTISDFNTNTPYVETEYSIADYGIRLNTKICNAKITIVYNGGLSNVPSNIHRAALLQTAYEWQAKDQIGAESVSTEGGMVSRPPLGLLKEVKERLNAQKHPLRLI